MLAFRKAKIRSHRKALLEAQRSDDSDAADLSDHIYRTGGGGNGSHGNGSGGRGNRNLGMGMSEVPLKLHVTQGVITRLQPYHLPLLLIYTTSLLLLSSSPYFPIQAKQIGNIGSAIVNSLSMIMGLLLSYENCRSLGKWEEGRKVWGKVRGEIRNGMRMISLIHPTELEPHSPSWTDINLSSSAGAGTGHITPSQSNPNAHLDPTQNDQLDRAHKRTMARQVKEDLLMQRAEELSSLLVCFAFALQYHLNKTRAPLSQPPFCDLLPQSYLSTLKRTDSSVRFADKHMEGVGVKAASESGSVSSRSSSPRTAGFPAGVGPGTGGALANGGGDIHRPSSPGSRGRMGGLSVKRGRKRSSSGSGSRSGKKGSGAGSGLGVSAGGLEMDRLGTTTEEEEGDSSASAMNDGAEESDLSPASGDNLEREEHEPTKLDKQINQLNVPFEKTPASEILLDGSGTQSKGKASSSSFSSAPSSYIPKPSPLRSSPIISITAASRRNSINSKPAQSSHATFRTKGVLANKHPHNLPLAILRMMEAYVNGMVQAREGEDARNVSLSGEDGEGEDWVDEGVKSGKNGSTIKLGWSASQGEKGWGMVRKLGELLGEAEMLADAAPPLSISLHLTHILIIVLMAIPAQLLPQIGRWAIPVTLISGWSLLGVQALSREIGGVFGGGDNNLPTHQFCAEILSESLDISDTFRQAYTRRIESRFKFGAGLVMDAVGGSDGGNGRVDGVLRGLRERRVEGWLPAF